MTQTILLTQGKVALVDDGDFEWLNAFNWHVRADGNTFYAVRRRPLGDRTVPFTWFIIMHRLIAETMGILTPEKPEVDHVDRDGLNNVRSNLRAASRTDNAINRPARGWTYDPHGKKPYKVTFRGSYIGRYATEDEAVAAYLTVRNKHEF